MVAASGIKFIGILESCFKEKFGTPRQPRLVPGSTAKLKIKAEFIPEQSLKGLADFSHVWLLGFFHLNTNKSFKSTVHPPRLKGRTVGVFASRSPHRPSPIGLSLARLTAVRGDTLYLSEIDLVDGTPILDIKPYIPVYDRAEVAQGGWTEAVEREEFEVHFTEQGLRDLAKPEAAGLAGFRSLVEETLRHDARNPRDKSQLREGKELQVWLFDYDVRFSVRGRRVTVSAIDSNKGPKAYRRPPLTVD